MFFSDFGRYRKETVKILAFSFKDKRCDPSKVKKPFMSEQALSKIGIGGFASEVKGSYTGFSKSI